MPSRNVLFLTEPRPPLYGNNDPQMILPGSYLVSILLLIAGIICWGSWANLFKAAGKWRYELYCIDFAVGALLVALITAFTFGSLGWDGFSFMDDVRMAGKRQEAWAFLAGGVFNIGNMLLISAVSMAGIAASFTIGLGVALIVAVLWSALLNPAGNVLMLTIGCVAVAGAIVFCIVSYKSYKMQRLLLAIQEGRTKSTKKKISTKPITVAIIAGVLIGSFYPLLDLARVPELGTGPYSTATIFGIAIFITTFVFNLFLMNLPIHGQPVEFGDYFKGAAKQHALGILSGGLFIAGLFATFVAAKSDALEQAGPSLIYAMAQGAVVLAALWGIVFWKEFSGAESKTRTFLVGMTVLLLVGVSAVAMAPIYGKH